MIKKYLCTILLSMLVLTGLTACHGSSHDEPDPEPPVSRTILVYMVADNTLGQWGYDEEDIEEMRQAVAAGHLGTSGRLLVYHAAPSADPVLLEMTPGGERQLKTYTSEVYSTDPSRLTEVVNDAVGLAPAEGYGIIFWSHSDGWLDGASPSDNRYRAFGDDRGHYMKLTSLAQALSPFTFDFIYFDCCLMANIETVWALRSVTPYIIASPTELSVHGMPYHQTLRHLFRAGPDLEEAVRTTFAWYSDNEDYYSRDCQLTLVSTDGLSDLADASKAILDRLTEYPGYMYDLQSMTVPGKTRYHVDMADYYHTLAGLAGAPELIEAWDDALNAAVPLALTTLYGIGSLRINTCCGLATFPITSESALTSRGYDSTPWFVDVLSGVALYK